MYGLTSQLRRAAISVPSNIAEGFGRRSTKDFTRFLNIAHGSLMELATQLYIAKELGYISSSQLDEANEYIQSIGRKMYGLIRSLAS